MKTAFKPQIVHESETQRQHARLPLPAVAEFHGHEYRVKNLSSGGIALSAKDGAFTPGRRVHMRLKLPFEDFSFELSLEAQIHHYDQNKEIVGCSFINLDANKISLLTHVLKAFIAGDMIASRDLIGIANRDNSSKERKKPNSNAIAPSLMRQIPGLMAIFMIGILIICFIGKNLYSDLFLVHAIDAVIAGSVINIHATAQGIYEPQIEANAATIKKNQILGTITPNDGAPVQVMSPCECYVVKTDNAGGFIMAGSPILSLTPINAKLWTLAEIDPSQIRKLRPNSSATITIFGANARFTGHIENLESGMNDPNPLIANKPAIVKIIPDQKIPLNLINHPASVAFGP